ncbi:hypothetical protein [Rhodovulum sp. MB263]|uniref:hypothetical protein n=1 Tax=Rhodovulum sp. (strain MB263) TaxID=308754 RepID=UPI0018C8A718|nr:hypothetical protein [Rhodovulum sp. MB263]
MAGSWKMIRTAPSRRAGRCQPRQSVISLAISSKKAGSLRNKAKPEFFSGLLGVQSRHLVDPSDIESVWL